MSQGKVIAVYDQPGENVFENPDAGGVKGIVKEFGRRFSFAGEAVPVTQKVYVVNTKECMGRPLGTSAPIPIHMKDRRTGLDIDGSVKISETYSYRIVDAAKFYKFSRTVLGGACSGECLGGQLEAEMRKALQYAVYQVTDTGVRPYELPAHAILFVVNVSINTLILRLLYAVHLESLTGSNL